MSVVVHIDGVPSNEREYQAVCARGIGVTKVTHVRTRVGSILKFLRMHMEMKQRCVSLVEQFLRRLKADVTASDARSHLNHFPLPRIIDPNNPTVLSTSILMIAVILGCIWMRERERESIRNKTIRCVGSVLTGYVIKVY